MTTDGRHLTVKCQFPPYILGFYSERPNWSRIVWHPALLFVGGTVPIGFTTATKHSINQGPLPSYIESQLLSHTQFATKQISRPLRSRPSFPQPPFATLSKASQGVFHYPLSPAVPPCAGLFPPQRPPEN